MKTASILSTLLLLFLMPLAAFQGSHETHILWHQPTEDELKAVIPARAPIISERIETEARTASGVTDSKGHIVAGVLLIHRRLLGQRQVLLLPAHPDSVEDRRQDPSNRQLFDRLDAKRKRTLRHSFGRRNR